MPLHDFQCLKCGTISEEFVKWDEYELECLMCDGITKRVYLKFNGIKKEDPSWLKDTIDVVDKDGGAHCQEFIKHPNRQNYNNWMDTEGLRPMDEGESMKKKKKDTSGIRKKVTESFRKRNTLNVRARS